MSLSKFSLKYNFTTIQNSKLKTRDIQCISTIQYMNTSTKEGYPSPGQRKYTSGKLCARRDGLVVADLYPRKVDQQV